MVFCCCFKLSSLVQWHYLSNFSCNLNSFWILVYENFFKMSCNMHSLDVSKYFTHIYFIYHQLRARRALIMLTMFHWEPEGHYHHRRYTAMAPFWLSIDDMDTCHFLFLIFFKFIIWIVKNAFTLTYNLCNTLFWSK